MLMSVRSPVGFRRNDLDILQPCSDRIPGLWVGSGLLGSDPEKGSQQRMARVSLLPPFFAHPSSSPGPIPGFWDVAGVWEQFCRL